jgi:hypothetical protein
MIGVEGRLLVDVCLAAFGWIGDVYCELPPKSHQTKTQPKAARGARTRARPVVRAAPAPLAPRRPQRRAAAVRQDALWLLQRPKDAAADVGGGDDAQEGVKEQVLHVV